MQSGQGMKSGGGNNEPRPGIASYRDLGLTFLQNVWLDPSSGCRQILPANTRGVGPGPMTLRGLSFAYAIFQLFDETLRSLICIGKFYPGLGHCSESVSCSVVGYSLRKPCALKRSLEILLWTPAGPSR